MVPSTAAMLAVWAFGGALAFAGALAYAELAAWRPQAGGEYVYLRESFGSLAGFLTGWTSFVAGFSGAIAFGSVAVAGYLDRFIPGAGDATVLSRVARSVRSASSFRCERSSPSRSSSPWRWCRCAACGRAACSRTR